MWQPQRGVVINYSTDFLPTGLLWRNPSSCTSPGGGLSWTGQNSPEAPTLYTHQYTASGEYIYILQGTIYIWASIFSYRYLCCSGVVDSINLWHSLHQRCAILFRFFVPLCAGQQIASRALTEQCSTWDSVSTRSTVRFNRPYQTDDALTDPLRYRQFSLSTNNIIRCLFCSALSYSSKNTIPDIPYSRK